MSSITTCAHSREPCPALCATSTRLAGTRTGARRWVQVPVDAPVLIQLPRLCRRDLLQFRVSDGICSSCPGQELHQCAACSRGPIALAPTMLSSVLLGAAENGGDARLDVDFAGGPVAYADTHGRATFPDCTAAPAGAVFL